jgi:hypothetical protein
MTGLQKGYCSRFVSVHKDRCRSIRPDDQASLAVIRGEDTAIAGEVYSGSGYKCETGQVIKAMGSSYLGGTGAVRRPHCSPPNTPGCASRPMPRPCRD